MDICERDSAEAQPFGQPNLQIGSSRLARHGLPPMMGEAFLYVNLALRLLIACVAVTHRLSNSGNSE
jgi:hypothetical protein